MGRRRRAIPVEVERLRARVEQWRDTRDRRRAMPAKLWREATEVARRVGAYVVVREVRVNYRKLKERMAATAADRTRPRPQEFVELTGAQILGSPESGPVLELSDKTVKLVVRLQPGAEVNAAELVSAFRRRA